MINDVGEKKRMGEEREGKGCFDVSWLVNHTPLQEMQHQRLQYQTMPNGMCTASITNDIARLQSFSFFFCASCLIMQLLCQTRYARKGHGHWPS